jgi:hypothetical protein
VNRVYQAEAERLLYRSIGWRFTPERLLSCLQTLVAAKSKAALVKSLVVTTISSVLQPILAKFVEALCTCLPNMTSLTSLRLHFPHTTTEYVATRLNPVLKNCTFSLTNLCINREFEFSSWVPNQTDLKNIAIHSDTWIEEPEYLSVYRHLLHTSAPENKLSIFCLSRFGGRLDTVYSYPGFCLRPSQWSAAPIKEVFPEFCLDLSGISIFSVLFESLSDHEIVREVITSISQNFPQIDTLRLIVKDHVIDKDPTVLASVLSLFPELTDLNFEYWTEVGDDGNNPPPTHSYRERKIDLATRWSAQCPQLSAVEFPDHSQCTTSDDGTWVFS